MRCRTPVSNFEEYHDVSLQRKYFRSSADEHSCYAFTKCCVELLPNLLLLPSNVLLQRLLLFKKADIFLACVIGRSIKCP